MEQPTGAQASDLNASAVVANAATPEPAKVDAPAPVEAKQDDQLSPRFAALARKQKQIEQEKAAIKAEKAAIEAERAEMNKWKETQGAPKKKLSPLEALMEHGYTYEQATEFILNDAKPTAEHRIKEVDEKFETRLEKLERELKEKDDRLAAAEKAKEEEKYAQTIDQFKSQINEFIDKNADKYELTKLYAANQVVFDTIDEYFEKNNKVLTIDEAAQMVESYLEGELDKAAKSKKFEAKYKSAPAKEEPKADDKGVYSNKTLSNTATASPTPVKAPAKTEAERRARALEILERASQ